MVAPRVALLVSSCGGAAETSMLWVSAPMVNAEFEVGNLQRVDVHILLS